MVGKPLLSNRVIVENSLYSFVEFSCCEGMINPKPVSRIAKESNEERLQAIVEYAAGRLLYPTLVYDQPFGKVISGSDFVMVTRIETADDLANYLTKDCCRFGAVGDALNIGFFGVDGIEGL